MVLTFVVVLVIVGVTAGDSTDMPVVSGFLAAWIVEAGIEIWYRRRKPQ